PFVPAVSLLVALPISTWLLGVALLVAVALFGDVAKGARRWLDLGFTRIQPSELMKIAMPMMLAWWFQKREGAHGWGDFVVAGVRSEEHTSELQSRENL